MEKSRILDLQGTPRHDQLYYYSKIKNEHLRLNQALDSPQLTFQPSVNKSFECEKTRQTFFERQQADCHEREYKQQMISDLNSTANLRRQMVPQVGRGPMTQSTMAMDRGHALYEAAFKVKNTIESKRREHQKNSSQLANEHKILATSSNFMDELEDKRIRGIFEVLDSDGDGIVNCHRINVEGIDPQVCKVLTPLFFQLSDNPEVSLDANSFVRTVKKFMKLLCITDRRLMLSMNGKQPCTGDIGHSFKPVINTNSKHIASQGVKPHRCDVDESIDSHHAFKPKINLYRADLSAYCHN